MKYGLWLRNGHSGDLGELGRRARLAEDAGWDGVFVSDSILDGWSDPWVTLGAVAEATERVTIGTWVVPVPLYDPWRLAHAVANLDHHANGRMMLGTGLGLPDEYRTFGLDDDPRALGRRYDEALDVITSLWTGEEVDHEGECFTLRGAKLPLTPVQRPRVPIVPAGWWPNKAPLRRAARWDGLMPFWPALLGGEEGPAGQAPSDADPMDELREMLSCYTSLTDDPGEIVLPWLRSIDGYVEQCEELGGTWVLLLADVGDDRIAGGPDAAAEV